MLDRWDLTFKTVRSSLLSVASRRWLNFGVLSCVSAFSLEINWYLMGYERFRYYYCLICVDYEVRLSCVSISLSYSYHFSDLPIHSIAILSITRSSSRYSVRHGNWHVVSGLYISWNAYWRTTLFGIKWGTYFFLCDYRVMTVQVRVGRFETWVFVAISVILRDWFTDKLMIDDDWLIDTMKTVQWT